MLRKCLEELKIPTKLINMYKMCTKDKKCGQNKRNIVMFFV